MEIKVPISLEEIKIVYLDDHLLFSTAMSQQCIYPYFPNASLIQFTNGNSAHDYLKNAIKSHDKIDLFITDINHLGMQGDCLSHAIRSYKRTFASPFKIPILIVSMAAENEESLYFDNSGTVIQKYLTKAASVEEIVHSIQELLK